MKILITGSSGLVGSSLVDRFCGAGQEVVGIDNGARAEFFGEAGATRPVGRALEQRHGLNFKPLGVDVRDTAGVFEAFEEQGPFDAVVHCAAQPSHDWAAGYPLDDFHINAFGTVKVLEACRRYCPEAPFVFMSTNKVYGLQKVLAQEQETRFRLANWQDGIDETYPIDQERHALYGAGKLAADVYVQEYGRYYGMRTVCLRAGCITGAGHAAVALHGFLSYLVKCNVLGAQYVVKGYKGKQVRDNIHAADLARLIDMIIYSALQGDPPEPGAVYNVGGGRANSCSIVEAFDAVQEITGRPMLASYDDEPRRGDHVCYYTDLRKVMHDYPAWRVERDLPSIYAELVEDWQRRA